MFRYSLRALIGLVAVVAVGCAALMNANAWIANSAWTLLLLLLALALGTSTHRGFWIGFAIFGWLYVMLICGPFGLTDELLTTSLLRHTASTRASISGNEQELRQRYFQMQDGTSTSAQIHDALLRWRKIQLLSDSVFIDAFVRTGQAFWTLILGLSGGLFAHYLSARPAQTGSSG